MASNTADQNPATNLLSGLPQYALDYAPIFHLHSADRYHPTSLDSFLAHTSPRLEHGNAAAPPSAAPLASLDALNAPTGGHNVYLTCHDDVTTNPGWLDGAKLDADGGTGSEVTGVVLVVEKKGDVVDVFYFTFWAFNFGGVVLGKELGNHVGDWEHVMIRFKRGAPQTVWLSQHGNGEAYAYSALTKHEGSKRPLLYAANGSHAIYARPGAIDHTIPNLNTTLPFLLVDYCDTGPLFDPLLSSYAYRATLPASSNSSASPTFAPLNPHVPSPGWLLFRGRWGDQAYPPTDARQQGKGLLGFHRFGDGPTGPADKELGRRETWPGNKFAWGQVVRTSLDGRTRVRDSLRRVLGGCFGNKGKKGAEGLQRVDVYGRVVG